MAFISVLIFGGALALSLGAIMATVLRNAGRIADALFARPGAPALAVPRARRVVLSRAVAKPARVTRHWRAAA